MFWKKYLGRGRKDRERLAEIDTHIAEAADFYVTKGMSAADARRLARLRFGNPRAYREGLNEMNRLLRVSRLDPVKALRD